MPAAEAGDGSYDGNEVTAADGHEWTAWRLRERNLLWGGKEKGAALHGALRGTGMRDDGGVRGAAACD